MQGRTAVQIRMPGPTSPSARHWPAPARRCSASTSYRRNMSTRSATSRARSPCPPRSSAPPPRARNRGAGRRNCGPSPAAASLSAAYSRIVSSIRYRAWPSTAGSRITSDLSTSAASVSSTLPARTRSSAQTCSAISTDQPGEVRQPSQQHLLRRDEQVVAPVDRGAQRPLARRRGPVPEVSSPNLSATRIRIWSTVSVRTRAAASSIASGIPSSERQSSAIARRSPGSPRNRGSSQRPFGKKLDGLPRRRAGGGNGQRRHRPDRLAGDAQRLPAGGHQPQLGRARQQPLAQPGDGVEQVLAVVEREQQPAADAARRPACRSAGGRSPPRRRRGRHAGGHHVRIGQAGQLD